MDHACPTCPHALSNFQTFKPKRAAGIRQKGAAKKMVRVYVIAGYIHGASQQRESDMLIITHASYNTQPTKP